jgi:hypothetical protein
LRKEIEMKKPPFIRGYPREQETTIRTLDKPHSRQTESEEKREEKRLSSLSRSYMGSAAVIRRPR